jgi:hypothetical protein
MLKKVSVVRKSSEVLTRIKPLAEVESPVTMLGYGESGTGKTVFGATFPKPLLLLDIREKGTESITDVPGIFVLEINKWEDLWGDVDKSIYWQLRGQNTYKTIMLDQLTSAQAVAIDHMRESRGMKASDPLSQRTWGQLSGMMQEMIYGYRDLYVDGYNILFLAHQRIRDPQEEEDDRLAPSVGSNLMPSVASCINGAVSVIGNTFIREVHDKKAKTSEVQYCMRVGPHAFYRAKIRRPVSAGPVPGIIVNPSYEKIRRISKGEPMVRKVKTVRRK